MRSKRSSGSYARSYIGESHLKTDDTFCLRMFKKSILAPSSCVTHLPIDLLKREDQAERWRNRIANSMPTRDDFRWGVKM